MLVPPSTSPATRTRHREALSQLRRAEILAAATRLFGRKGFEATRAEEIALAAKIAKGTLYLYFASKEAIYTAAVAQAVRELQAEVAHRSAGATGFRQKLANAINVRLSFWPKHEAIYRLLLTLGREARHRRQTNEVLRTAHRSFLDLFTEGVEAGEIEAADLRPLAWAVLDMVRGANERRMDKQSTTTAAEDAAWITACALRGVHATAPERKK